MTQTAIPFLFMRGGSSRGPYMLRRELPADQNLLAQVLMAAIGAGHPYNIDGIGGGNAVTTKVAMLSISDDRWADIDFLFAQIGGEDSLVDFKPTCGNILAGVGPAAIEMGLMNISGPVTEVKIRAVNTGARIIARIQTPNQRVTYDGLASIDGIPGQAAPIELNFMDVAGSSTGALLPTGHLRDRLDGIEVTCLDVAMPMVIARATDFGLTGNESQKQLDQNKAFFARMENIRLKAGAIMGLGDCRKSVTPKFGLLAPTRQTGHIIARYFMPWATHPSMAVTGSQCMASCALMPGTIGDGMMPRPEGSPATITLHHPMGVIEVVIDYQIRAGDFIHNSAGLVRTARKLAAGELFVPRAIWDNTAL